MGLFSKWQGVLCLPQLTPRTEKIGDNFIWQIYFRGSRIRVRISDLQYPDHDLIETSLKPPYGQLLLRRKGARRITTTFPVVTVVNSVSAEELNENATLVWDSIGELEQYATTPDAVLASWRNKFEFREEDEMENLPGLRPPQIGALHAIAAHFAVGSRFEPATVVLPTGTGKTETMLATQVYRQLRRTLVLVPSDALRNQISRKFLTLGVLPDAGTVPPELPGPHVARISSGVRSPGEAKSLIEKSNVIIALPDTLRASDPESLTYILDQCSDLIVDEAHHVTASTWSKIRDQFKDKRILQFTATPFRRDGKRIDGKIIFNYKLGDAQAAGYYRPINLRTVEEFGDEASRDRAVATAAIDALRWDREKLGLDHLLMARTQSKERADRVWALYRELAPDLHPVLVYSGARTTRANREALKNLLDRGEDGARIIVCVDMLGEGFDLPNLKIAALHDTHKSLAVTLQFIGRFTRKGAMGVIGEATVV